MMSLPTPDMKIYKAQDKSRTVYVADANGNVDLTSHTLTFTVHDTISGAAIITKSSTQAGEIDIDGDQATNKGKAVLTFVPADTSPLDPGRYYYKFWDTDGSGLAKPFMAGYFWVYEVSPFIVSSIREVLGDAGELHVMKIFDEITYPSNLNMVYTSRRRLVSVEGIWLLTDEDHTGTNYYTGGGFDPNKGKVWLGTSLPTTNLQIRISYTWEAGITDDALWQHLWDSQVYCVQYTGYEFTYGNATTTILKAVESMSVARAMIASILTVNGANVAQMGYNFRIDEFEVQTKLWGEGMIAEALFTQFRMQYEEWKQAIGKAGTILVATPETPKYDIETLIGYSDSDAEGGEGF